MGESCRKYKRNTFARIGRDAAKQADISGHGHIIKSFSVLYLEVASTNVRWTLVMFGTPRVPIVNGVQGGTGALQD